MLMMTTIMASSEPYKCLKEVSEVLNDQCTINLLPYLIGEGKGLPGDLCWAIF